MNDLGTALRELAGEVTAPHAADPGDLWSRGRSRVRRRGVAAVVAMLVLGALGYVGIARPTPTLVMPAGAPHAAAIPENIWAPNRFLAGVSETGAPGQLAVIASTQNDGNHYFGRWFGISATTGRYVALDLPGKASDSPMWLSPDGTRIAYAITGRTGLSRYVSRSDPSDDGPMPVHPPTGIGVYDTRNGSVARYQTLTSMGWSDHNDLLLSWTDDSTVIFTYSLAAGFGSSQLAGTWIWHPGSDKPSRIHGSSDMFGDHYTFGFPSSVVVRSTGDGPPYSVVNTDGRATGRLVSYPVDGRSPNSLSLSGNRVVLVGYTAGTTRPRIFVADQARQKRVHFSAVSTLAYPELLGWRSDSTVLVLGSRGRITQSSSDLGPPAIYSLDLATNRVVQIGSLQDSVDQGTVQVANSLLVDPLVRGRRPPSLLSAFGLPLGIAGAALVAGAGYLVYRRRRARYAES